MIFDTHAHLNFSEFEKDRDELIKECLKEEIGIINVGTNFKSSQKCLEISEKHTNTFSSVGLHPSNIDSEFFKHKNLLSIEEGFLEKDFNYEDYKKLAQKEKVVAIGEAGLDYWYRPKGLIKRESFKKEQKNVFEKQLLLAEELDLPVIIHCRNAFDDVYEMIAKRRIKGVLHCFTGDIYDMERFTDLGLYLGINGIIFKMDLREVIGKVSLNKILLETDCPYLSPKGFEERNNPLSLNLIIEEISRIRGVSNKEIKEITRQNTKELFKI